MDESISDDSSDEDPVELEVDVFLAKALAERLYLFQYPVRPSCLSYDEIPHATARIKPKHQKVELELELDTGSARYCFPRGEQIAYAVDEAATASSATKGPPKGHYYHSGCMDKQVLSSVRASEETSKYVAGVFKEGVLNLTPIHGFVQLRPSFEYLNRADDNKQTTSSVKTEEVNDEEEEAKPVITRFARPETEKTSLMKKQSFQSIEQKLAEEPWIELKYRHSKSPTVKAEKMLLQCHQSDFESPEFTATSREYLNVLSPKDEGTERHPAALPHGVLSMASLKRMDLVDQIKALLINAKVIQHHHLLALLGPSADEKTILRGLNDYGYLVQGCWVVRSEILYPRGSKAPTSGIKAEAIWPARDFIMWRFNYKRMLERKDIISTIRLPSEELRDMLEHVARQRPPQGWEFIHSTDVEFLQKHPDVVRSQLEIWKRKISSFKEQLTIPKEYLLKEEDILPGLDVSLHSKGRMTKPRTKTRETTDKRKRGSGTDDEKPSSKIENKALDNSGKIDLELKPPNSNPDLGDISEVKVKSEPAVFVKSEPMDFTDIEEHLSGIEMVIDSDKELASNLDIEIESTANSSAAFVPPSLSGKGQVSLVKPPSDIFIQELDKFLKETLKGGCLSIAEIKDILTLRQQEPGNILCSGVSDELLEREILNVGASRLTVKWPDNVEVCEEKKKIFAFRKIGDQRDKFRQEIFNLFEESFMLKKAEIFAKLKEKLGSAPSNHMFPRIMGEFCEKYERGWYLRGTYKAAYPDR